MFTDDIIPDEPVIESASLTKEKNSTSSNITLEQVDALLNSKFDEIKAWLEERLNQHHKYV